LYTHAKTAGFLYQAALREQLTLELGVRWTVVSRGTAEIAGVPGRVLEHFSQRRAEIREAMAERGTTSSDAARVAALATRRAKEYGVEGSSIYERWQARAAEHGLNREGSAVLLSL
jgi:conjugative relaxase-like TrwC/TraI family protein